MFRLHLSVTSFDILVYCQIGRNLSRLLFKHHAAESKVGHQKSIVIGTSLNVFSSFQIAFSFEFIQQCIRLRLNNAGPDDSVVIGIWYSNPQRLDIHYKGEYVPALNMEKNAKGKYDSKPGVFMPTTNMPLGKCRKSFTNEPVSGLRAVMPFTHENRAWSQTSYRFLNNTDLAQPYYSPCLPSYCPCLPASDYLQGY